MKEKMVAILSGGLDSSTAVAVARSRQGCEIVFGVFYQYKQTHALAEMTAAYNVARHWGIPIQTYVLPDLVGSALTLSSTSQLRLPFDRTPEEIAEGGMAPTYVPNRNAIMTAHAAAVAYSLGVGTILGGWHAEDTPGYPDCTDGFLDAMEKAIRIGTGGKVRRIMRPLIDNSKADIVREAFELKVPIELTWSCYNPIFKGGYLACGRCDSCVIRLNAFKLAGMEDPIPYAFNAITGMEGQ